MTAEVLFSEAIQYDLGSEIGLSPKICLSLRLFQESNPIPKPKSDQITSENLDA